jgi:hypothetical protein
MIACDVCGIEPASDEVPPLSWAVSFKHGATPSYCCATCARDNLRKIENRIDRSMW